MTALAGAMRRRARRARAVLTLIPLLGGCFAYVPTELDRIPDGEAVRVLLSRDAALRLTDQGAEELVSLDRPTLAGALRRRADGGLALRVPVRGGSVDGPARPIVQELLLERADVLSVEQRRLDRTRTTFASAAAVGAATAAVVLIVGGSEGQLDRSNPGGSSDARLP